MPLPKIPWTNGHRFQEALSPFIDGELSPRDSVALEVHLQTCAACAEELAELRLAVAVLRDLPAMDVPRSFALTPQQAGHAAPRPFSSTPALVTGLRAAGVFAALALASVLFVDLGTSDDNGEKAAVGELRMEAAQSFDADAPLALSPDDAASEEVVATGPALPTPGAPGETSDSAASGSTPAAGVSGPASGGIPSEGIAGDSGGNTTQPNTGGGTSSSDTGSEPAPAATEGPPAPAVAEDRAVEAPAAGIDTRSPDIAKEAGAVTGGAEESLYALENESAPDSNDDDGLSNTTILEIALASVLAAAVAGSIAFQLAARRR